MFRIIVLLLVCGTFIACNNKTSDADKPAEQLLDTAYTIAGVVKDADSGSMVILEFLGVSRKPDTTFIKGTEFEFKGKADESIVSNIYLQNQSHDLAKPLKIMVENAVINIEGEKNTFHNATVIGGIRNTDFNALKEALLVYEDSMNVILNNSEAAIASVDTLQQARLHEAAYKLELEISRIIKQFALEHPKSVAGAYYVTTEYNYSTAELDSIYNSFDSSILKSVYVQQIKTHIDGLKRTAVGQVAPDFELTDLNGKAKSLSSLKSKYLFVDFWASWCAPCRAENPTIVQAYKEFKNKGFAILGVSLDDDKQAWLQAVKKDKLTWLHVSDLKGWESKVVPLYGLRSIPANFLLDETGKIIARDLHGTQLREKLALVFK